MQINQQAAQARWEVTRAYDNAPPGHRTMFWLFVFFEATVGLVLAGSAWIR